jgi:hypothetical protein
VSAQVPAAPGWYPDPADPAKERFWLGSDWSGTLTRPNPGVPVAPSSGWGNFGAPWQPNPGVPVASGPGWGNSGAPWHPGMTTRTGAPVATKKRGARRFFTVLGLIALVIIVVAIVAGSSGANNKSSVASGSSTDSSATATSTYISAYNTMISADNPDIVSQNSHVPTTSQQGINDRITVHQAFDAAMTAISFPSADQSDALAVIAADGALENALGNLAVNVNNVENYNSAFFSGVSTADNNFASAIAALNSVLGVISTPTTG